MQDNSFSFVSPLQTSGGHFQVNETLQPPKPICNPNLMITPMYSNLTTYLEQNEHEGIHESFKNNLKPPVGKVVDEIFNYPDYEMNKSYNGNLSFNYEMDDDSFNELCNNLENLDEMSIDLLESDPVKESTKLPRRVKQKPKKYPRKRKCPKEAKAEILAKMTPPEQEHFNRVHEKLFSNWTVFKNKLVYIKNYECFDGFGILSPDELDEMKKIPKYASIVPKIIERQTKFNNQPTRKRINREKFNMIPARLWQKQMQPSILRSKQRPEEPPAMREDQKQFNMEHGRRMEQRHDQFKGALNSNANEMDRKFYGLRIKRYLWA